MKLPPAQSSPQSLRTESDNLCKRLAELFPDQFAEWVFGAGGKVKIEKTELDREPIRADSVIFSRDHARGGETLHAEFQTTMKSDVPVPLRMLDYYVGLKRQKPKRPVRQVLIVLKETSSEIPDHYEDGRTVHYYDVIEVWKQDPQTLLRYEGLLPLATLCHAESGQQLLTEVAARISRISSPQQRREAIAWSYVLAGLRYDESLINRFLKEASMLEESVTYQSIFQKGEQRGEQRGEQQGLLRGELKMASLLLEERFGGLSRTIRRQMEQLPLEQIEELGKALLAFSSKDELRDWLKQHAPKSKTKS
ncbi:MAG: DUF4351 domain-containing protein [Acidobacteriota bacterium]